jgi:hypothetical protein
MTPLPEDFPGEAEIADGEAWAAEAGVSLDVRAQAKRFRNHAATKDRRERNWPAAWRQWIDIAGEDAEPLPAAPRSLVQTAAWSGPPYVWDAVVEAKGEPFAISWLSRCLWRDLPTKTLSGSGFVLSRLRNEVGHLLREMGIQLEEERAA